MSFTLAPTTELDAVNELLATIGEAPVNTLTNTGLGDAATARTRLYNASRNLQKYGWSWNTDYNFKLLPDTSGNISVPFTTLQVRFIAQSDRQQFTLRGTQIYDGQNHTYTFLQPVMADVVQMLDFSLLPETARQAIFVAAGIRFQAGFLGSEILDKFTSRDLQQAWDALKSDDLEVSDWNMLTDSADMLWANNRLAVYGNFGINAGAGGSSSSGGNAPTPPSGGTDLPTTTTNVTASMVAPGPGIYVVTTPGVTITLGSWSAWTSQAGTPIVVKDLTGSSTPNITIVPVSGGQIDGGSSATLNSPKGVLQFFPFLTQNNWVIA